MDFPGGNLHGSGRILGSYCPIAGSTDPILIFDINLTTILKANPAACDLLEYTSEELRQIPVKAIYPNGLPALRELAEKVRLQLLASTDKITVLTRTGRLSPVEFAATLIERGDKPALLAMMRDITPKRACCESPEAGIESYLWSKQTPKYAHFECDVLSNKAEFSDEMYEIYGFEKGSIEPGFKAVLDVTHPDDRTRLKETVEEAIRERKTLDAIYRIVRADGSLRYLHTVGKHAVNESGDHCLMGTVYDISEQVCYQSIFRDREAILKLVNDIAVGITSEMTIDEAIKRAVSLVHNLFPHFRVSYGVLNDKKICRVIHSLRPENMPDITGLEYDLSAVPDAVDATTHAPLVFEDVRNDVRLRPFASRLADTANAATMAIPFRHGNHLVGLLTLSSREPHCWTSDEVTTMTEVGKYLSIAIKDTFLVEELRRNEARLRQTAARLRTEHIELEEKNIALKQILGNLEKEKELYRDQICESIEGLLSPIIAKLKSSDEFVLEGDILQLERALNSILSKEIDNFKRNRARLTPRELDICELIAKGMSSKEISEMLYLSPLTVHKHRESIRRKLQLKNRNINLGTYLRMWESSKSST